MQRGVLDINGVPTAVLTYGKWIQEVENTKEIILIIPGNPGVTGFYKMFMHILHEKTGLPVWIISHAGHEIPRESGSVQKLKGNEELFNLKGQLEHKKEFIRKYVPENTKIHLVAHSIGSYITLGLLRDETINSKIVDVKLLFPTVEYMAETPNGVFFSNFVTPIIWLILFLSWIYTILPSILQNFFMYLYMKVTSTPKMHFRTLVHFVDHRVLEKVLSLAVEELKQVKERDNATIKANKEKIKFLYGKSDGWAPPNYFDNLKGDIVGVDAELSDYYHTFVLKQSRQIGNLVGEWIINK